MPVAIHVSPLLTELHADALRPRQLVKAEGTQADTTTSVFLSSPGQGGLDSVGAVKIHQTALKLLDEVVEDSQRVRVGRRGPDGRSLP